jgi:hypothetical protein
MLSTMSRCADYFWNFQNGHRRKEERKKDRKKNNNNNNKKRNKHNMSSKLRLRDITTDDFLTNIW